MSSLTDIARLNVLIELLSECANTADLEALLRVAAGRLRWIIDFARCTFALARPVGCVCWIGTHAEESLRRVMLADLPEEDATLIERVIERSRSTSLPST